MQAPSKSFWKGFALGALLLGALGAFFLNWQVRLTYAMQAIGPPASSSTNAVISLLMENEQFERAQDKLRISTHFDLRFGRFAHCMSEYRYHLWMSGAYEGCYPILEEQMPEDWEIPGKQRYMINEDGHVVARDVSTSNP
jgi:hypothetical protein